MFEMTVSNRARVLNNKPLNKGLVVCWMIRDQRVSDNWALLDAQKLALETKSPLSVVVTLRPSLDKHRFTERSWWFMSEGLKEVERKLKRKKVGFKVLLGDPVVEMAKFVENKNVGAVVCDFSPLLPHRRWRESLAKKTDVAVVEVDAHNVVPVWVTSDKQEYAARTIRPKINKVLPKYLVDFPKLKIHPHGKLGEPTKWKLIEKQVKTDARVKKIEWIEPGSKAAKSLMNQFIEQKLWVYEEKRNDANVGAQSDLSPFLHFGQISAQRVALEVTRSGRMDLNREAFLEELIVRRELADNFCLYNQNYKKFAGFPDWAKKTLNQHRKDKREYLYTQRQFENANTHDELWNAAQIELVKRGKMHGYMRMYWAKKILEWSMSPEEAMEIAIELNDKYSLDGRDANGYTGIAWSIGGVHDRPWFERPVFGKVRYMARSGCEKKFNVEEYIGRLSE